MKSHRSTIVAAVLTALLYTNAAAQGFTWKKGSNATNQSGIYGNISVPASTTNPGPREGAVSWKDANGNLWLFGGYGYDFIGNTGIMNDLWKYDPVTNLWTWVSGDNVILQPGDYGTLGVPAPTNKPGSRQYATSWIDQSGNLWLFGGNGLNNSPGPGYLHDLWKYDIGGNVWTWMGGTSGQNSSGLYGSLTIPSATNMPGGRHSSAGWSDGNGNFWLLGGFGYGNGSSAGHLADLWKYSISTGQWTWMKGPNMVDQNGVYGTQGTAAASNFPGSRKNTHTWVEPGGNAWVFGGTGFDASIPAASVLNDLWKYDISTNEWTWQKGSNAITQNGVYGNPGVGTAATVPGSRFGGLTWIDAVGNLWLHGGRGLPASGLIVGQLNDLWRYVPSKDQWIWTASSAITDQNGSYGTINVPGSNNRPGGRHGGVSWIDASNDLWLFGGNGFAASGGQGYLNDLWKYTNCQISPITMTIVAKDSSICAGESTSLTASGGNNYVWAHNSATISNVVISPQQSSTYTVSTNDAKGCTYSATFTELVDACLGVKELPASAALSLSPNPASGNFRLSSPVNGLLEVRNAMGALITTREVWQGITLVQLELPSGLYYLRIAQPSQNVASAILICE